MTFTNSLLGLTIGHLWQSTLCVAIAGAVTLVLRKNGAKFRHAAWLIASIKFLVPFSLLVTLGTHLEWPLSPSASHSTFSGVARRIDQGFSTPIFLDESLSAISHASVVPTLLVALWFVGFAAVLFFHLRSWLRARAYLRAATPLPFSAPIKALSTRSSLEPGVFGIVRPVLLLPEGIASHLTPAHFEAILAHELCHVRRRDNLWAALHMFVEAVFWFHPLVWWIGSRLVEERERACDEEVVRAGNRPDIYAESILRTCQFYLESPVACVSGVTGANLKKRIVHIMTETVTARLTFRKKLLLAAAGIAAVAMPITAGLLHAAQAAGDSPRASFEVASIKPSKAGDAAPFRISVEPGGRFVAQHVTLAVIMQLAYHVREAQIIGAPSWANSFYFDLEARPDESAATAIDKISPEERTTQMREMTQALLADRFKLTLRHETKELPVYALLVAKDGPKFRETQAVVATQPPRRGIMMNGRGQMSVNGASLDLFIEMLSRQLGRVVMDKTGLKGRYDFKLNWTPDEPQGPAPAGASGGAPEDSAGPSLFAAIQEQLGLKLESQKAPVDVLFVEHAEKPSEN